MIKEILKSPYDLVRDAIDASPDSVTDSSAMGVHPNWDSFNHVSIIVALEQHYHMDIPDDEVLKYNNMAAILELYEVKSGLKKKPSIWEGIKKFVKKFKF